MKVLLKEDVMRALAILAEREDRDPTRQAERLIREGLQRRGLLPGAAVVTGHPVHASRRVAWKPGDGVKLRVEGGHLFTNRSVAGRAAWDDDAATAPEPAE